MKTIIIGLILCIGFSFSTYQSVAKGNKVQSDTITIKGNCGQCKDRIEEAAYVKGVKSASWDKTTKILTVVYSKSKTNLDKITTSIANAGHDSALHTAKDEDYKKIPSCCAYRTGSCDHE